MNCYIPVQQETLPASVNNIFYFFVFKAQNKAENHGFGVYQQFQKYSARKAGSILH